MTFREATQIQQRIVIGEQEVDAQRASKLGQDVPPIHQVPRCPLTHTHGDRAMNILRAPYGAVSCRILIFGC